MQLKSLLLLSLALNVGLASFLVFRKSAAPAPGPGDVVYVTNVVESAKPSSPAVRATPSTPRAATVDWRTVESDDYKQYITNLRGIGCPEETIRDIIVADVNKMFEARRKALPGSTNRFQFWKTGSGMPGMLNLEQVQQQQEVAREKRELLKTLLGADFEPKPEPFLAALNPLDSALDFLPTGKQAELMDLETRYAARLSAAQKNRGRAGQEEVRKIQAEKQAELAQILSPQEKEEYDLRLSQTAITMRNQLNGFEPTEQEFRDIFKLKKAYDDQWSAVGSTSTPDERTQKATAQKELESQVKTLLGEDRYADYKYGKDWSKSALQQVAESYNIPKSTAFKVFDLKTAAQDQVRKLRQDQSLNPDQRQAALRGVREETERAVTGVLGERAAQDYITKGNWIKSLSPDPGQTAVRQPVVQP